MIVLKFGGTSVGSGERMRAALEITGHRLSEAPVLVSSALGKTTDHLLAIAHAAVAGAHEEVAELRATVEAQHYDALNHLCTALDEQSLKRYSAGLRALFEELDPVVQSIQLTRDFTAQTSDTLLSFGERLSTYILYAGTAALGIDSVLLDSRQLILTDDRFGSATPRFVETEAAIRQQIEPRPGLLYITQGFVAATEDGATTTLGRGGSDYSATIIGGALGASRVEIWTDVHGIMTADPRIVPAARTISELTYNEAAELSFFGARVIHPATMVPAVERGIPVHVCNSFDPDGPSSIIRRDVQTPGLKAIAGRQGVTIVSVHSSRMLNAWGFLSRMFRIFEEHRVIVDLIATSEVSVSVSIDRPEVPEEMVAALEALGNVQIEPNKAVLSLVGEGIWNDTRRVRDVFAALSDGATGSVGVEMISLGSSDTNLSIVLGQEHVEGAIQQLHSHFFPFPIPS